MLFKVTGIKHNLIIDNNVQAIIDCFNNYVESEKARNVQTHGFSTIYTNLRHDEIKKVLNDVVYLSFKHSKCLYISIYDGVFQEYLLIF